MLIKFSDRLDRVFNINAKENDRIYKSFARNHIPIDAVMVWKNGEIMDDDFEFDENREYHIEMVRA